MMVLQLGNITKSKDIELITGSVSLEGKKKMLVCAFYRPPDKTDEDYLNKVKEEISTIKEKHLCNWRRLQSTRYQLGRTNHHK
jgi:hypothetical protein